MGLAVVKFMACTTLPKASSTKVRYRTILVGPGTTASICFVYF